MEIPHKQLSREALAGLVEEFVTRDGTDYGETEASLDVKCRQVLAWLEQGRAAIVFDEETQTCNIVARDA